MGARTAPAREGVTPEVSARIAIEPLLAEISQQDDKFMSALSRVIAEVSCQERSRAELAALGVVMNANDKLVTITAVNCLLGSAAVEDVVTADALVAWEELGRPPSAAVEAVRTRAQTFRIRKHFMTPEEMATWIQETPPTQTIMATIMAEDGVVE